MFWAKYMCAKALEYLSLASASFGSPQQLSCQASTVNTSLLQPGYPTPTFGGLHAYGGIYGRLIVTSANQVRKMADCNRL